MFNLQLRPPIRLLGQTVCFLEDAAYLIRQHAISKGSPDEWRLVRRVRDANDLGAALLCERQVRACAKRLSDADELAHARMDRASHAGFHRR